MKDTLKLLATKILGEQIKLCTYKYSSNGIDREICSYVRVDRQPSNDLEHIWEHWQTLIDANICCLFHLKEFPTHTVEEAIEAARLRTQLSGKLYCKEIWLIMDRSLDCQLSFLDFFGYSKGTALHKEQISDCKKLLTEIYGYSRFSVYNIMDHGMVAITFDEKQTNRTIEPFFNAIVEFMEKYDHMRLSRVAFRKELVRSQTIIL